MHCCDPKFGWLLLSCFVPVLPGMNEQEQVRLLVSISSSNQLPPMSLDLTQVVEQGEQITASVDKSRRIIWFFLR